MNTNNKKQTAPTKTKMSTIILTVAILLVAYLVISAVLIYIFNSRASFIKKTEAYFPFPAAIVSGKIVTVNELNGQTDAVRKFYENQDFSQLGLRVDFSTPDGQKRLAIKEKNILNKNIENIIIEKEANTRGIKLTPEMIAQEVSRKMDQYGSAGFAEENLKNLYGWTLADFENNIVKPDLYREKLYENIEQNDKSFSDAKEKMAKAQEELKNGKDFESVVGLYSEGDSLKNRGDLGWFGADEMLPELSQTAFLMDKGAVSEVIRSPLGFHIIKILDKKTENDVPKIRIGQVFARTMTLGDWISERGKNASILVPLKDYRWNKKDAILEFSNSDMKKFEENILTNFAGDASILF